jgi:hypothetical protein
MSISSLAQWKHQQADGIGASVSSVTLDAGAGGRHRAMPPTATGPGAGTIKAAAHPARCDALVLTPSAHRGSPHHDARQRSASMSNYSAAAPR